MADQPKKRRRLRYTAIVLGVLVVVCGAGVLIAKRMSDGPLTAMIPGGPLRAGTLAPGADLAAALTNCGQKACPTTSGSSV